MPFEIIRNDITKVNVDVIVNAANNALQFGGGVCGAIFTAAGAEKLQKACNKIGGCETGQAIITKGYALLSKYIIHTVSPKWQGGNFDEHELLYACYKNSLELAKAKKLESIAFPLISSGVYGYPKDQALRIAVKAIGDFLLQNDMNVSLVVYDTAAYSLSEKLYNSIKVFIDDHYADSHYISRRTDDESKLLDEKLSFDATTATLQADAGSFSDTMAVFEAAEPLKESIVPPSQLTTKQTSVAAPQMAPIAQRGLGNALRHLDETFSQHLLRLIDGKGHNDADIYKRANIDRRVFSKIRSNKDYRPSKNTAIAFAIALELNLDETRDLLLKAGFALSRSNKLDVIVEYFITERNYNIFEINEALFTFDQNLLGD